MKLSAPVYHLKRQARLMARAQNIPLHAALDKIASGEGFLRWSLLARHHAQESPASRLLAVLEPGELVLVGARPGHGKTLFSLELCIEAMERGQCATFYSLEYVERDILDRFRALGAEPSSYADRFVFDGSDRICADYIIADARAGTLVVVDYLQLLDQKRDTPPLGDQVRALGDFARRSGVIVVFIAQIDRRFDAAAKAFPDARDIRLPNPLDPGLFTTRCFLNGGAMRVERAG